MQELIRNKRFALVELALAVLCGAVWMIKPEWGIWFILIALLPLALKIVAGSLQFGPADWLVIIFLLTSWAGYWSAYNPSAAWVKAGLVVTSVLLYFSLKSQPKENLFGVALFLFFIGIGVSLYFFLTHDFVALPRKIEIVNQIGYWIMSVRPKTGWTPIHPNYVAGMIAITVPFISYPVRELQKKFGSIPASILLAIITGLGLAGLGLLMATSRGILFAIASGVGGWLLWRSVDWAGINRRIKNETVFPVLFFIYLIAVVAFLFVGPAQSGSVFSENYYYGNGSRAELFSRSIYLLFAYPITGGGLTSFPGLYSQYLLDIPFYNVPNSHNLFLDVGIEQGLIGGLSFLSLYLFSLWTLVRSISKGGEDHAFRWVVLFSLTTAFIHGMVDDYLYNGAGTALSLFLVGLSMNLGGGLKKSHERRFDLRTMGAIAVIWLIIAAVNLNQIRATWYANLGAVQLSKEELKGFPQAGWATEDIVPRLAAADASLHSALQFDPTNRTANQRLGLIYMYRRDFKSAVSYLETAHMVTPEHRGITKSLAYCYIWLGDIDKAQEFLVQLPEAMEELDVYVWWWEKQGRSDLSDRAQLALDALQPITSQP